jgi:hypothetical protein|tara:strand:- start:8470 stop:9603 length:1134 start_codon:yes stop_codon:yes gene_type:complete
MYLQKTNYHSDEASQKPLQAIENAGPILGSAIQNHRSNSRNRHDCTLFTDFNYHSQMNAKEKNTVDYFPFFCKEGKAMYYIENKYGNDGFAVWIKLLRELAVTNHHFLDLSDETGLMYISSRCRVSEEMLSNIITDLSKLGEFDKTLWNEHQVIWSEKFYNSIKDVYRKRSNECTDLDGVWEIITESRRNIDGSGRSEGGTFRSEGGKSQQTKQNKTKLDKTKQMEAENFDKFSESESEDFEDDLVSSHRTLEAENLNTDFAQTKQLNKVESAQVQTWPTFEDFWEAYKKKRGDQEKIRKKWEKLKQSEKEAIMEYIPRYIESQPDKQFRKDPSTFLNNKSWNDEIITRSQSTHQPASTAGTVSRIYQKLTAGGGAR